MFWTMVNLLTFVKSVCSIESIKSESIWKLNLFWLILTTYCTKFSVSTVSLTCFLGGDGEDERIDGLVGDKEVSPAAGYS